MTSKTAGDTFQSEIYMKEYQAKEKLFLSTIMSGFADLKSNVLMASVVKQMIRKLCGKNGKRLVLNGCTAGHGP